MDKPIGQRDKWPTREEANRLIAEWMEYCTLTQQVMTIVQNLRNGQLLLQNPQPFWEEPMMPVMTLYPAKQQFVKHNDMQLLVEED